MSGRASGLGEVPFLHHRYHVLHMEVHEVNMGVGVC